MKAGTDNDQEVFKIKKELQEDCQEQRTPKRTEKGTERSLRDDTGMKYTHVWNERMDLDGMVFLLCKCKRWRPSLCMGYKDTVIARLNCREYICPECCEKLPEGELTSRPIFTVEELMSEYGKQAALKMQASITG